MWNSTKKTIYDPCPPGFCVPPVQWAVELIENCSKSYFGSEIGIGNMMIAIQMDDIWFSTKGYRRPKVLDFNDMMLRRNDPRTSGYSTQHNRGFYWTTGVGGHYNDPFRIDIGMCLFFSYETGYRCLEIGHMEDIMGLPILPIHE